MSVSEGCRLIGTQTLRLCDEFYAITKSIEGRRHGEVMQNIKFAAESVEKFHVGGVFGLDETKDYLKKLNELREDVAYERYPVASSKAARPADDVGWNMLNKLVGCERGKK